MFYCGNVRKSWKTSITSLWRIKHLFIFVFSLFYLSCILSHNSHEFLYLNGINPCIECLDMYWNIWNLILWRKLGKKRSSCSDYSECWAFILWQSNNSSKYSPILEYLIPWVERDNNMWRVITGSQMHMWIIWIFFLVFNEINLIYVKSLVDAELLYILSGLANCDHLHLLISDWINMAFIHVLYPHVISFLFLVGFIIFDM